MVMFSFGLVGLLFRLAKYPLAPIVIGIILGPILETNMRRAMLISRDGYWIFLDRPVSALLLVINIILILVAIGFIVKNLRKKKVD